MFSDFLFYFQQELLLLRQKCLRLEGALKERDLVIKYGLKFFSSMFLSTLFNDLKMFFMHKAVEINKK